MKDGQHTPDSAPPVLPRAPGGKVILCAECVRLGHCRLGLSEEALVYNAPTTVMRVST
jgi:hypothetical protein